MNRVTTLSLLALLALPATASAAPAKIGPTAKPARGTTAIEVANPNVYALTGRATMTVAGRSASRQVRLPRRSVTTVKFRLAAAEGRRPAVVLKLRRRGGRVSTVRRTVTLRSATTAVEPAAGKAPAAPAPAPVVKAPVAPAAAPPAPTNRWVGRMGSEGGYDDLELTLDGGQIQFTKAPIVPVFCFETPNSSNSWTSGELFDASGPWVLGSDSAIEKQGVAVNPLVGRSPRTITYKVTGTSQQAGKVTGTLGMIFYAARPDVFTGAMTIVNCAGSESFEAVPAG